MKTLFLTGAVFAVLASGGAAYAQSCSAGCDSQHATCARAGKDYGTCMGAWHQCKAACLTPARTSSAPPPKATPAVVRR